MEPGARSAERQERYAPSGQDGRAQESPEEKVPGEGDEMIVQYILYKDDI